MISFQFCFGLPMKCAQFEQNNWGKFGNNLLFILLAPIDNYYNITFLL
jgi:hypothetical protein